MNHILEHIADAGDVMKNIKKILKPNGVIFLEVPDCTEYANYADKITPYAYLNFEHIIHFCANDIENIAAIYGYSIIKSGDYYKKVSEYPSIWAILKPNDNSGNVIKKSTGYIQTEEYINLCRTSIINTFSELKKSGNELILWGIGASTAAIVKDFEGCNIVQLIDANPSRQGIKYTIGEKTLTIASPDDLLNESAAIFVLSGPYKASICRQIKEMKIKNPVYTF